jgi:hypothetical protein
MKNIDMAKAISTRTIMKKSDRHAVLAGQSGGRTWYKPTDQGFEQRVRARLEEIRKLKTKAALKHK